MVNIKRSLMARMLLLLLIVFLLIQAILVLRRTASEQVEILFYAKVNRDRAQAFLAELSEILDNKNEIRFVFGASSIEGFFDPARFAKFLPPSGVVYNLGFRSMGPLYMEALAGRLKEEFDQSNRKVKVSYIRLETLLLTKRFIQTDRSYGKDLRFFNAVYSLKMLKKKFFERPVFISSIIIDRFAFANTSPYDIRDYLYSKFVKPDNRSKTKFFRIWIDPKFEDPNPWDVEGLGLYGWNRLNAESEYQKAIQNLKAPKVFNYSQRYFEHCCDIKNLELSEELTESFLNSLELIKSFSEKVIVFYYPEQDSKNYQTVQALKSLHKLSAIAGKAGAKFVDFTNTIDWNNEDYADIIHLSPKGLEKLYMALSQQ